MCGALVRVLGCVMQEVKDTEGRVMSARYCDCDGRCGKECIGSYF